MKPTVGRIVHYPNLGDRDGKYSPEIRAALITGLNPDGTVSLHIFSRTGQFDVPAVQRATDGIEAGTEAASGTWQWPGREG